MSVIFGVINFNNNYILKDVEQEMITKINIYKLDDIKTIRRDNILFGCGIQYITPESLNEILPYFDERSGLIITADAIIDNRTELFSLLNIPENSRNNITDSQLILESYKKWGSECTKYLVGDFAFVIWDEKKQSLYCARDHVGNRTFYYYYADKIFSFCTVIKPLFNAYNSKIELNERWITDYLAIDGIAHEVECFDTAYKNIYQLMPAHYIILDKNDLKINKYWDPLKEIIPLKLKTDEEYDEAFRRVFFEAVYCRLRNIGDTAIMMSGGLDSTSVACAAAKEMGKEGKRLKAFSSIPTLDYNGKSPKNRIPDETEYIESIKENFDNIDITYCRSEGKHPLSDMGFYINVLEQPYKTYRTIYWYNDIIQKASKSGCKVILNGQNGNCTISNGNFITFALTLYRKGRILTLLKEIRAFSSLIKLHPHRVVKIVAKAVLPYKVRNSLDKKRNKGFDRFYNVPVKKELIKKWDIENRLDKIHLNQLTQWFCDFNEQRALIVNPAAFTHVGTIEAKMSLAHGVVIRDPTKDKRVIEFCLSLPAEQFVRNGEERHLIRRSMKGILPDKIRLNLSKRGLQSADWLQRLQPHWEYIYHELEQILDDKGLQEYVDTNKLKERLDILKGPLDEKKESDILMLLTTLIFYKFMKSYNI